MFTPLVLSIAVNLAAPASQTTPPLKGWDLLNDSSRRAYQFFVERTHPVTGFAKDRSANYQDKDRPDNNVSSVASTGYALAAYAVGQKRGWMNRKEAIDRTVKTLDHLYTLAPRHRGWFYHFIDWENGKRMWNCEVSTIDSGLLFAGMILAEQSLKDKAVTAKVDRILKEVDWTYMRTDDGAKPNEPFLTMGWTPERGFIPARWGDYSEQKFLTVISIGTGGTPVSAWTTFKRPSADTYGMPALGGGPLFIHQMSEAYIDFKGKRDSLGYDYWVSARNLMLIQREYAKRNPKKFAGYGADIWGLSACDIPSGYGAQGFPVWGDDNGTLAAPAALASVMFTPKEAMSAAEGYLKAFPDAYGRYGFPTGMNPTQKWRSPDVIGIDHGQMMLAIENARDGYPQKMFMSHPIVRRGLAAIGLKTTEEGPVENRALRVKPNP